MSPVIVVTLLLGASYIVATDMYIRRLKREAKTLKEMFWKSDENWREAHLLNQRYAEELAKANAMLAKDWLDMQTLEAQHGKAETPSGTQEG